MNIKRSAKSVWKGGGKDGKGRLTTPSGVLNDTAYAANTRFENEKGTNPEELIAAAHAGCFNMALSFILSEQGVKPDQLETTANVTIEKKDAGWEVTTIHLDLKGKVPGMDQAKFQQAAEKAKAGCPISKLLKANITMSAKLES